MKPLHFAPLQGYTDDVYRRLHHRLVGGIAAYYTPFVRWEHGGVRSKDLRDIAPEHNEGVPVVPQIIAADADELARLVDVIAPLGYRRIDLNMGCPFPLQARHGRGSGLLPLPERAAAIFERMGTYPEVGFSVKLRLGWDDATQLDRLAPLVAAAPLVSVALHPRLGVMGYKGTADRAAFARFAAACPHPLLYNGDLLTPTDVEELVAAQPTVAGVMIGRGLLARPSLSAELRDGRPWSAAEQIALLHRLHDGLHEAYARIVPGDEALHRKLRPFWDYAEATIGRKAFKKVQKAGNLRNYLRAVAEIQ
jgi:hypothetical protein